MAFTNARLGVGRLNNFRLNATTTITPPAVVGISVGGGGYLPGATMDGYLRRQKQYRPVRSTVVIDQDVKVAGPTTLITPRSLRHTLYIQRASFTISKFPAVASEIYLGDTFVTPMLRPVLYSPVPNNGTLPGAPGLRQYLADYGPDGLPLTQGAALYWMGTGGSPWGVIDVEGYQRLTGIGSSSDELTLVPALMGLRPILLVDQFGEIGAYFSYNRPLVYTNRGTPTNFFMRSANPGSYADLGIGFSLNELATDGSGNSELRFRSAQDTRALAGRTYYFDEGCFKQGWYQFTDRDTGIPINETLNGVTMTLVVP